MEQCFLLLVLLSLKHTLADFVFQTYEMVQGKGQGGFEFIRPLASHCLIHVSLTALILLVVVGAKFLWFVPLEFLAHFIIDRLKAGQRYFAQFSMIERPRIFWATFGADQFLHQMTYIFLSYYVSKSF